MTHKVKVEVARAAERNMVLATGQKRMRAWLARLLFGADRFSEVLVLSPGRTVRTIEIMEVQEMSANAG